MTEDGPRTGAVRDVPAPRPVPPTAAAPAEETGLGRAARAVADAVAGLIGPVAEGATAGGDRRPGVSALRDVIGAVAGAVGGAFAPGRAGEPSPDAAGRGPSVDRSPGALLGDLLAAVAPRLPIRDADRLRRAFPGASEDEIAGALTERAARVTSGIGAAVGGLTAAQWFALPSLVALPLELGAETVLVAGVEVVLLGELHELYGRPADGDARTRAGSYLASWSAQRSVEGIGAAGLATLLGSAGVRELRRRVTRRFARAVPSAAPFLLGAAIAGRGNRRATETLARRVLTDLRSPRGAGPS